MSILKRFRNDERGAAIVEAAIVLPLGFLILAGGFELARGFTYHHAADKAARDVARYMARLPEALAADDTLATRYMGERIIAPASATHTANLVTRTVEVNGVPLVVKAVQIQSSIAYDFPLLSILNIGKQMKFTIEHEQPLIGE